jgi:hypothetical protein
MVFGWVCSLGGDVHDSGPLGVFDGNAAIAGAFIRLLAGAISKPSHIIGGCDGGEVGGGGGAGDGEVGGGDGDGWHSAQPPQVSGSG